MVASVAAALGRDAVQRRSEPAVSLLILVFVMISCSCCSEGQPTCHDDERRALLEIKKSINHPNGSALPDWGGGDEDCCRWSGIVCDRYNGRVLYINMYGARVAELGTWYPNLTSLMRLRELKGLDLGSNQMGGTLPDVVCSLKHLKALYLNDNSLKGAIPNVSSCFQRMNSLIELELSGNQLQGNILPYMCNISSLRWLGLDDNQFQGNIPSCLSKLHNLELISFYGNKFEGSIPANIFSNLTKLIYVGIGGDELVGTLPFSTFANLSNLQGVAIFSGYGLEIDTESPSSWVPSFQLEDLYIQRCKVNGNNGGRFPSFISSQSSLLFLGLESTSIEGTIPGRLLCNSSLSLLNLSWNMFRGMLHLPCRNNTSCRFINLSHNRIHGSLPADIGFSFPNLEYFIMAGNDLEGSIPPSLGQVRHLTALDLSDNHLFGKLPHALTKNQSKLQYLNVSHNYIEGEMLPIDTCMPSLEFLVLNHNRLTGSIPPKLSNSSHLRVLLAGNNFLTGDLSHGLPTLPTIVVLSLRENHLDGHIPSCLCELQHLQVLDLFANSLSGKIPSCLNNVSAWKDEGSIDSTWATYPYSITVPGKNLSYITDNSEQTMYLTSKRLCSFYAGVPLHLMTLLDLSSNQLDGHIPWEIGELRMLRSLNLSNNHLQSCLPTSMGNMKNLESFDLSHNSLSGKIPHELTQLNYLSTFTVAFNHLSGVIPHDHQFLSFSKCSYEGNPGLCGAPLERNCTSTKGTRQTLEVDQEKNEGNAGILDNDALFYSFLVLAFALGFWSFIGLLFFNKKWRVTYFRAVDRYLDLHLIKALLNWLYIG